MAEIPIGARLKAARLEAKISQKKLGIAAGIDEFSASARMNQYEKGKHIPDFLTLKRIAGVMNISPAYFYADTDELADIIYLFSSLSKKDQKKILNLLKTNTSN
jgi:transcriptional regulator with XRE-family HTH domain